MSDTHSQSHRKLILKPCASYKIENEEKGKDMYDHFHRAPVGKLIDFVLAEKMAGMHMNPTPPKEEFPEVEKEETDTYISFKITFVGGLRRKDVKVFLKKGVVFIEVDQKPRSGDDDDDDAGDKKEKQGKFCLKHAFDTPNCCKLKDVKAKLTNGVLKVVLETVDHGVAKVPKFKRVHKFKVEEA